MPKYIILNSFSVKFVMAVQTLNNFLKICFIFEILLISSVSWSKDSVLNFGKAKSILANQVYGKKNETFYCKCRYQKKSIKAKSCDILTKKYKKRKKRLEWEHIVHAHAFGNAFKEWRDNKKYCPKQKSKRKCTAKLNSTFREIEGNLHNLVPSVGAVNALRSNLSFAEFRGKSEELCKNRFWKQKRKINVAKDIKGDIARIYFYMNETYPGRGIISKKNMKLFEAWNKIDPVSEDECRISRLKAKLQGSRNKFVEDFCK